MSIHNTIIKNVRDWKHWGSSPRAKQNEEYLYNLHIIWLDFLGQCNRLYRYSLKEELNYNNYKTIDLKLKVKHIFVLLSSK